MSKVLLDEMLPRTVAGLLPEHDVQTAVKAGLAGVANGAMLRAAVEQGFTVVVTRDTNMPDQQNLAAIGIGLVLVSSNDAKEIAGYVDDLREAVANVPVGGVLRVPAPSHRSAKAKLPPRR